MNCFVFLEFPVIPQGGMKQIAFLILKGNDDNDNDHRQP